MKKALLFFFLILASCFALNAQSLKKIQAQAEEHFEEGKFKPALPLYLKLLESQPDNADFNYRTGICYLESIYRERAIKYILKAQSLNSNITNIDFVLGLAYQYAHDFEKAKRYFQSSLVKINKKEEPEKQEKLERKIYECDNGIFFLANPVKAKIDNIGATINSKYPDYAPVISADESIMVFTSRREGSTGGELAEDHEMHEDIYISYKIDNQWTTPKNLGPPVNSEGHDASIAFSANGTTIFIYKDENGGDIYSSTLKGSLWTKPQALSSVINTKHNEPSVSLSADGNTLYFSSNKPGGMGGLDIYKTTKDKKGRWTEAVNLGPKINTKYDDDAPFLHPDGITLYFSSKGHKGMGEFDIFKSSWENNEWQEVENLGYPINSADDDIYFVLSADNSHGYYASAKEESVGEKDIYIITMPKAEAVTEIASKSIDLSEGNLPKKRIIAPVASTNSINPITILKGTVRDALTKLPLEAKIIVTDNTKNEVLTELESNSSTGSYLIIMNSGRNYGIRVEKDKYLFHSENFDIPSSNSYQEIIKDIDLKKIDIGTKIVLRNIFFDFDKAHLRPESASELERLYQLLVENPKLKIEISGHTDNKGGSEYNKKLSDNRAAAVVDFLIAKGIAKDRLKHAGYGFDRPVATNDTDAGRQSNRRTEFEVLAD